MEPGYCAHYGALIAFAEFERTPKTKETNFRQRMKDFEKDVKNSNETQLKDFVKGGMIYPITSGLIPLTSEKVSPTTVEGFKSDDQSYGYKSTELACEEFGFVSPKAKTDTKGKNSEYYCLYNDTDISVSTIIEKGKSMTGPFVALYSSVLSFADLKAYTELGTWQLFIVSLINLIF